MKTRSLLLGLCLLVAGQMHATNQVALVTDNPPGIVRLGTNLTEFAEAALPTAEAKQVEDINPIAWAAKSSDLPIPPLVSEEIIVLMRWTEQPGKSQWCAAHLMRGSGVPRQSWAMWASQPVFPTRKVWEAKPSDEEVAAFIRATSFGHNEHDPEIHVLRVVAYQDAKPIVRTLVEGVSEAEKSERRAKLRSVFWHRRQ